jgi:hypothetical protein
MNHLESVALTLDATTDMHVFGRWFAVVRQSLTPRVPTRITCATPTPLDRGIGKEQA